MADLNLEYVEVWAITPIGTAGNLRFDAFAGRSYSQTLGSFISASYARFGGVWFDVKNKEYGRMPPSNENQSTQIGYIINSYNAPDLTNITRVSIAQTLPTGTRIIVKGIPA